MGNRPTALIVDDETNVRRSLAFLFEASGWEIAQAADGLEALALLAERTADLLITDIRMPGIDGWSLAERVRACDPSMPVLYVTGWSGGEERPVPGSVVISKPYEFNQLLAIATRLAMQPEGVAREAGRRPQALAESAIATSRQHGVAAS